ncbi:MAG: 2Fe-2S iron-sulfur cluster-binding protein [Spirochaetota bacterium]
MITLNIDDKPVELKVKKTLLNAAREMGIKIPTLCNNDFLKPYGGCRLCLVEIASVRAPDKIRLLPACTTEAENGMIVFTSTERVKEARKFIIELFLSRCPGSEEIRGMAKQLGVPVDDRNALDVVGEYLLYRTKPLDETKCILCSLCVRACAEVPERHALSFSKRGVRRKVKTPYDKVAETCIGCGSCAYVCPTNAITIEEAG